MRNSILFIALAIIFISCLKTTNEDNPQVPEEILNLHGKLTEQYAADKRVALFDVNYNTTGKTVTISGVTTSGEAKTALIEGLETAGYSVSDSLRLLPDGKELEGHTYGIVRLSVCNMRIDPDFSAEMTSQALLGMPVRVLEKKGWYRIQTPDNYIAWVHPAAIETMEAEEYDSWNSSDKIVVTSHYGFAYARPDMKSQPISDVVSGNRLRYMGTEGDFYKVGYPDGVHIGYLPRMLGMPEQEWRMSVKQDAGSILRTALSLNGVPYLWAGTSAKGMDCSGFVRTCLFLHDIIIPRDASQQAYIGERVEIAPDFSNLREGDLLFFGRKASGDKKERIVHVGFSLGKHLFIHSLGSVRRASFDPGDEAYDEYDLRRLLFAVRFLPYINKRPEVNTTSTNSYYQPTKTNKTGS